MAWGGDGLAFQSALTLRKAVRTKAVSPVELVREALMRAQRLEPALNAFVTLMWEEAMASARRAEAAVMAGETLAPLLGLPISVKDLIAVRGVPLTFGSKLAAGNIARVDSPAVERLKAAGACIIGKTTTSEFGAKAVGDSPLTGLTRNPWNLAKSAGGSSGGAAASVAAGVTPFALGTDGGGSIRIPCSFTGIFGFKPTFGRVPFHPAAAAATLAHIGPLARTVRDAALLLSVVAGFDRRDPLALAGSPAGLLAACDLPVKGLRVAWSATLGYARPEPEVLTLCTRAAEAFARCGCAVTEIGPVIDDDPIPLWTAEFYGRLGARLQAEWPGERDLLDPAVAALLDATGSCEPAKQLVLDRRRAELRQTIERLFERFDLLLSPTLPCPAFAAGRDAPPGSQDGHPVGWVKYTYPFNLTGHPACSVPAGFTRAGLPVGLQIVARMNGDADVLRAAAAYEEARPWAARRPNGLAMPRAG